MWCDYASFYGEDLIEKKILSVFFVSQIEYKKMSFKSQQRYLLLDLHLRGDKYYGLTEFDYPPFRLVHANKNNNIWL